MYRALYLSTLTVLVAWNTACVSMSSLQTARTLDEGESQQSFGGGIYKSEAISPGASADISLPYLEATYRHGLAKDWEIGAKITIIGTVAADGKYQLYAGEKLALSTGLGLGYFQLTSGSGETEQKTTVIDGTVPLNVSYDVNESFTPYLSTKYVLRSVIGNSTESLGLVGATVGAKIGDKSGVFVEATYMKAMKDDFKGMQYNIAYFWQPSASLFDFK